MHHQTFPKHLLSLFFFLFLYSNLLPQGVKLPTGNPLVPAAQEVVDFSRLTPERIREATEWYLAEVKTSNTLIGAVAEGNRTFQNTMSVLEQGGTLLDQAASIYEVISSASPDKALRDAANEGTQEISNFATEQSLNESLYKAVKAYALTADAKALTGEHKYYLSKVLRDYEREGFALSPDKRDTLKMLNNKIQDLSLQFRNNIAQDNPTINFTEAEMAGLPEEFKKEHKQASGTYLLNVSNPTYIPFMNYSKNTEARKRLYLMKTNVAAPKNDGILAELLKLRERKAKLLGKDTYADYATESIMSKNKKNVWDFENQLKTDLRPKALSEYKEMLGLKSKETGKTETVIFPYECMYYTTRLLDEKYKVDEDKVKEYFELQNVIKGLFAVYQRIYNLSFTEDMHPAVWNKDVQAFNVTDNATRKIIGYFYLDLYPRDNKYKHAACFPITPARNTEGGRQLATASLICNFPKPSPTQPSLMTHQEVQTIFHEFGHLMHAMVSETELGALSGTSVATDFVEAPSQIMENWVWSKQVLSLFAKHYKTGQMIPSELLDRMIASKRATSGLLALQQVFYGTLDFTLNDGFQITGDQSIPGLVGKLQNSITLYPFVDGSHFEASFGHLTNYGSQYYGYLWSLVYAQDMYSVFEADPLSPETGNRFRRMVLAKGGSDDPLNLVRNFLGREPNNKAFLKNLGL
jgi:thimet oligopeptidase